MIVDHLSIMLDESGRKDKKTHFRFEKRLKVANFEDRVADWSSYRTSFSLAKKLKLLKGNIRLSNMELFGRVEVKIRKS